MDRCRSVMWGLHGLFARGRWFSRLSCMNVVRLFLIAFCFLFFFFKQKTAYEIAVHELFPAVASVEELHGSYIELYYDDEIDKAVVEHSFLNAEFDIETLAQDISNYAGN